MNLYSRRRRVNQVALTVAMLAACFGLLWLVWILWTLLSNGLSSIDLALFTEARYTRHPSQADRFTPFQEHPASLEHFPSGSIAAPPRD